MTDEELRVIERECKQILELKTPSLDTQGNVAWYTIRWLSELIGQLARHVRKGE